MRFYAFGNFYLSSIQQGIQAAHVVAEMFCKYPVDYECIKFDDLNKWAHEHKTMILLNGGAHLELKELLDFFHKDENPYPFDYFIEPETLNDTITSAGIVLPEKIYEGAVKLRGKLTDRELKEYENENALYLGEDCVGYSDWEKELMERLNKCRLAN